MKSKPLRHRYLENKFYPQTYCGSFYEKVNYEHTNVHNVYYLLINEELVLFISWSHKFTYNCTRNFFKDLPVY